MPGWKVGVEISKDQFKEGWHASAEMKVHNSLIESRECFVRLDICNQSKSLQDNN
jgi:hypothetical protein